MKKVGMIILTLVATNAFGANESIKYGNDLCQVVTFRTPTKKACETDVLDRLSTFNVFSIALNICVRFNEGPASRSTECFMRAAQWITNQDVKNQAKLCDYDNRNYINKADCLQTLFTHKNQEEVQRQQATSLSGTATTR